MTYLGRTGDPEDRAAVLFREGFELASRCGDTRIQSRVLNGFGTLRINAGEIAAGLDLLHEAIRYADGTDDTGLSVAALYPLSAGYMFAAQLGESLAAAEQGLERSRGELDLGVDELGFSPTLALSAARGLALSLMGRPREGGLELDRALDAAREPQQLHVLAVSHLCQLLRCEVTGEVSAALTHSRQALECAEQMDSQIARSYARLAVGIASVMSGEWKDALEISEDALSIARERRLLLYEGSLLAVMAAAHLGVGDALRASTLAEEAIAVCRRRGTRLWEIQAQLIRIRALRAARGVEATEEIEATLAEAGAWLEMSGGKSHEPFVHVERAELARLRGNEVMRERELREAHRLFLEIGAPIRAEQVAKELRL